MNTSATWRPTAGREALQLRARALTVTRAFFAARAVLEVETPALVQCPVSDVNISSVSARMPGSAEQFFLHTSPEYAMKRLLAAGSGDIFQVCHVFRGAERGRQHNPEFTMLEWYRLGFSLEDLMREVADLVQAVLGRKIPVEFLSYRDALQRHAQLDPLAASDVQLRDAARSLGLDARSAEGASRDDLLDLVVGAQVGPKLGLDGLTFLHRYPASQAALARLDSEDPRMALRFELYHQGMELANGYHELVSPAEQRARFQSDLRLRQSRDLPAPDLDERFLAALQSGLPDCAGVALGFDRLLMLASGAHSIDEVLAFPSERA